MTAFFRHLIERAAPSAATVMPRLRSRYEAEGPPPGIEGNRLSREREAPVAEGRIPTGIPHRYDDPRSAEGPDQAVTNIYRPAGPLFSQSPLSSSPSGSYPSGLVHPEQGGRRNSMDAVTEGREDDRPFLPGKKELRKEERVFPWKNDLPAAAESLAALPSLPGQASRENNKGEEHPEGVKKESSSPAVMASGLLPHERAWLQDIKNRVLPERTQQGHLPEAAPTIKVTIGRIEVKAMQPPPPAVRERPGPPKPRLSLDEFLKTKKNPAS